MRVYDRVPDRGLAVQLCEGPADGAPRTRVNLEPGRIERGLLRLVLSIVELLRQLMEKQALRRIDAGSLSPDDADRVGRSLMEVEETIRTLQKQYGIDDLNLELGPLGRLLREES
jgi:Gas vesicle protein K